MDFLNNLIDILSLNSLLRFITTIYEVKNVWANDAHKVAIFISLVYSPFLLYILLNLKKNSILNKLKAGDMIKYSMQYRLFNVEIIFLLIIISFIIGSIGIGQIIVDPIYDAIIRSIGIILFMNGILLYLILYSKQKKVLVQKLIVYNEINIYKIIRNPEYTFLLMIALGASFITINLFGIMFSVVILIPFMLIRIKIIERNILANDPGYSNYIVTIPKMIPSTIFLIKRLIFKKDIIQDKH